jgi:hypothetical protein
MQLQLGAFNLAPTVQLVRVAARLIRSASLLRGRVQNATSGLVLRWVLSMHRTRVPGPTCAFFAEALVVRVRLETMAEATLIEIRM